jgi:hypothetical protein
VHLLVLSNCNHSQSKERIMRKWYQRRVQREINKRYNGSTDGNNLDIACVYCRETITLTFRDKQVTEILLMKSYYTRYYAQTPAGGRRDAKSRPVHTARAQHHKALELHGTAPALHHRSNFIMSDMYETQVSVSVSWSVGSGASTGFVWEPLVHIWQN